MPTKNALDLSVTRQAVPSAITRAGTAAGLWEVVFFGSPSGDFTLQASNAEQNAFPTTCDVITVEASTTYHIEGLYIINTGGTTHTTAMSFVLGGGASVQATGGCEYRTLLWSAAANTLTTTQSTCHVSGVASKVLNATSGSVYTIIDFKGMIRTNAAGTITPSIKFSSNPTGTNLMKASSWIRVVAWGSSSVEAAGGFG